MQAAIAARLGRGDIVVDILKLKTAALHEQIGIAINSLARREHGAQAGHIAQRSTGCRCCFRQMLALQLAADGCARLDAMT